MMVGWSCFRIGKLNEAEAQMRKAVDADPGAYATHSNMAVVLQAQMRLDEAATAYERALNLNADNTQCLINLGACRVDQGDAVAGEAYARRAIAIDGERARAWANLGVALARLVDTRTHFRHSGAPRSSSKRPVKQLRTS